MVLHGYEITSCSFYSEFQYSARHDRIWFPICLAMIFCEYYLYETYIAQYASKGRCHKNIIPMLFVTDDLIGEKQNLIDKLGAVLSIKQC